MKKIKYALCIAVLIFASNAYGQMSSSKLERKGGFRFGLFYSSDKNLSADNIKLGRYDGYHINYNQLNFTAGLTAVYYLLKNFTLRSGINYSNKSFSGTYYCYTCDFIRAPQPEKFDLQLVQIPVAGRYYVYVHNIGFFGEAGIINQVMMGKPNKYSLKGKTYSLSGKVAAGVEYNLSHGFAIQLSGKYTHGFSKIFKSADYSYKILGVQLSLLKNF